MWIRNKQENIVGWHTRQQHQDPDARLLVFVPGAKDTYTVAFWASADCECIESGGKIGLGFPLVRIAPDVAAPEFDLSQWRSAF